ncbi:WD40-repeat-containing domain protein [Phlyctochytrium arcticum]|nr:WD40-repeat-containing domain protein [Phlyctochytrium arcticum]
MAGQSPVRDETAAVVKPPTGKSLSALLVSGNSLFSAGKDGALEEWNTDTLEHVRDFVGHRRWVRAVATGHGRLFSAAWDDTVKIWSLDTAEVLHTLSCPYANALHYEPATNKLYGGGGESHAVFEWDVNIGVLTGCMEPGGDKKESGTIECLAGDGTRLFVGMSTGAIAVYEMEDGTNVGTFEAHTAEVTALQIVHQKLYSSGNDCQVCEWDIPSGNLLRKFEGHDVYVSSLTVGFPVNRGVDGRRPSENGEHSVRRLGNHPHQASNYGRDDGLLVSGSWNGYLRVWNVITGDAVAYLRGHRLSINACQFAPGRKLFTADSEGAIKCWDLDKLPPATSGPAIHTTYIPPPMPAPQQYHQPMMYPQHTQQHNPGMYMPPGMPYAFPPQAPPPQYMQQHQYQHNFPGYPQVSHGGGQPPPFPHHHPEAYAAAPPPPHLTQNPNVFVHPISNTPLMSPLSSVPSTPPYSPQITPNFGNGPRPVRRQSKQSLDGSGSNKQQGRRGSFGRRGSVTSNGDSTSGSGPSHHSRRPPMVCQFHMQGRCRFGDTCRNIHPLPTTSSSSPRLHPGTPPVIQAHMFPPLPSASGSAHGELFGGDLANGQAPNDDNGSWQPEAPPGTS